MNNNFITLEETLDLDHKTIQKYYRDHVNNSLYGVFKLLGLTELAIKSASGSTIKLQDGRQILDFTSSCGVLNLGHNHPAIIAAEEFCHRHQLVDALKFGINNLQAVLAKNLAALLPAPLDTSFFTVSGAEAIEAGIKLMSKVQGDKRPYMMRTLGGFHGKTHGALPFTEIGNYSEGFRMGFPSDQVLTVEYGNLEAVNGLFKKRGHEIAGIILESVQGMTVTTPPAGYLAELIKLCHQHGVLVLFDEVKSGIGRTGHLFYFQSQNAVPDIVVTCKALGGGKRALGAMITSRDLWRQAYGSKKSSTLHSSTFDGLGESCAVAIKTLELVSDPEFLAEVQAKSKYFMNLLESLKEKHPTKIKQIRGTGLMLGLEFNFPQSNGQKKFSFIKDIHVGMMGSVMRELVLKYDILTYFAPVSPHIMQVLPPLTIERKDLEHFVSCLDELLNTSYTTLLTKFCFGSLK